MTLSMAAFLALAASCAPAVAPETLAAVVRTESGFNALAIGNNATRRAHLPATLTDASAFIAANPGVSLDIGIAQISSRAGHLQRRGLPLTAALDPCTGLRIGGEVLADCFRRAPSGDEQARLAEALSCYNTGTFTRGVANGYVQRVQAAAEVVVPAIRTVGALPPATRPTPPLTAVPPAPNPFVRPSAARQLVFTRSKD